MSPTLRSVWPLDSDPARPPLSGRSICVVGGDEREVEVLRCLIVDGASVSACGCPPNATQVLGVSQCSTLAAAIAGADAVVTPIPVLGRNGELYAPAWPKHLCLDEAAFTDAKADLPVLMGTMTEALQKLAERLGLRLLCYGDDEELAIRRAPSVVEGALALAISGTAVSIHDSRAVVIGFGRLGFTLTRTLLALGSRVTAVARDPVQRARAWELGASTEPLNRLADACGTADFVFNTVPAPVLSRAILARMTLDVFVVDLADPPGGTDFQAAEDLRIQATLGRGLGGRAPRTVGRLQYSVIRRMLLAALA